MSLLDDIAQTRAQSQALCRASLDLCATALSLTNGYGKNLCSGAQWRYFAERLAQDRIRLYTGKKENTR